VIRAINILIFAIFCGLTTNSPAYAQSTETFRAEARKDGELVYREKHVAKFDEKGAVETAVTEYFDPEGKLIATLHSNFEKSVTAPDHEFHDLRFETRHGMRSQAGKLILFDQDRGKKEESKTIAPTRGKNQLVVGCQGLGYYFRDNLDSVKQRKKVPVQLLVPGKLDSYNFELVYLKENDSGIVDLKLVINNWFLKVFAPQLDIKYDRVNKRFLSYKGLSNLLDNNRKEQVVDITYQYDTPTATP